jgi:hypothetical protein
MVKRAEFSRIVILESLSSSDLHAGRKIREDIEVSNLFHDRGLQVEFHDVAKKADFISQLGKLTRETKKLENNPFIHIEAHGSSDTKGLILGSGEFVSWEELKRPLIDLNIATRNNLFIVLSACYGAYLTTIVLPTDRAPCFGLVGPTKVLGAGYLLKSFSRFYQELLASGSGSEAVKQLNLDARESGLDYSLTDAETFFAMVNEKYFGKDCTNSQYEKRAREIIREVKSRGANPPSVGSLKRFYKGTQPAYFEMFKRRFFMIDLFPENANRFTIKYEDIMNQVNSKKPVTSTR